MQKIMENKGITLVALVVTIIIMLILAGVTLSLALSDNGLFNKTKVAVDKYQIENEKEALSMTVTSYKLGEYLEDGDTKIGKELLDRNLENSSIWDIIVEKSNNKTYGTGWNYVEKGTEIEGYGKTKNNWVVNYETGEIIYLEDEGYNNFDYNSTIAVTDGIVFNLDSANVGLDKASWGKNATLYYYDNENYDTMEKRKAEYEKQEDKNVETYNSGYDRQKSDDVSEYIDETTGAFKFNGNNYIELYDSNGYDFSKGLTFEFYGKILGNDSALEERKFIPFLGVWNGKFGDQCSVRFGYYYDIKSLCYNLGKIGITDKWWGSFSVEWEPWNQKLEVDDLQNKDVYVILSFDPSDENQVKQNIYIYIDGTEEVKKYSGTLMKEYFDDFVKNMKELNYLELGRCTMGEKRILALY